MKYPLGTTLKICYPAYTHYGIYCGFGLVIHNSKESGKVVYTSLAKFANSKKIDTSEITGKYKILAVFRAIKNLGKEYNLFSSNCEHFVRGSHKLKVESHQIQNVVFLAGVGVVVAIGVLIGNTIKNHNKN